MSLRKRTKKSSSSRKEDWSKAPPRSFARLVFGIVLITLIGVALIWSVSRNREPTLRVDLSVGTEALLAEIAKSDSARQLKKMQAEIGELLVSAKSGELRPLLEISDAVADQLIQLEQRPDRQEAILDSQLAVFRDLSRVNLASISDVHWHQVRFERLSSRALQSASPQLQRSGLQGRLLEWQLQLVETRQPLADLAALDRTLLDLLRDSPGNSEVLTAVEQIWERSPKEPEFLPQLEQLTRVIEQRLSTSDDPEIVRRGKRLIERYWMVAWNLQGKVEQAVLTRDQPLLEELHRAALELLQSNPTPEGIGLALRLAAALEGERLLEAAAQILETCEQLSITQATTAELAAFQKAATESLERLKLYDQTLALDLDIMPSPGGEDPLPVEPSQMAHTLILQFLGSVEEFDSLEPFCANLQTLRKKGYRLILVPCSLTSEQLESRLLEEGKYRFDTLAPAAAIAVQQALHQSSTPRTMIIRDGKLHFSGLPNRRLYLDLEREAFSRSE